MANVENLEKDTERIANVGNSPSDDDRDAGGGNGLSKLGDMHASAIQSDTLKRAVPQPRVDLSRADLIRLLSYLEGELQARDIVIATLKAEKAKQLLYQAKYGRLGLNDPFTALQRDSEVTNAKDDFDESAVGQLYESQLAHLERLIAVQRRAHHRAKQVLAAVERRHSRSVRELEQERKRRAHEAAQGDDVCMMLEKERERLKQELENQKTEQEKVQADLEKLRQSLVDEKARHKQIVLCLLQERRQLIVRAMEERQKVLRYQQERQTTTDGQQQQQPTASSGGGRVSDCRSDDELRKELELVRKQLEIERRETNSLRETVKTQEEDLKVIRRAILSKSRQATAAAAAAATTSVTTTTTQSAIQANSQQPSKTATTKIHKQQIVGANGGVAAMPTPTQTNVALSPSTQQALRYQILTRPGAAPASAHQQQHHYASTDLGAASSASSQAVAGQPQQQQQPPPPPPSSSVARRPLPPYVPPADRARTPLSMTGSNNASVVSATPYAEASTGAQTPNPPTTTYAAPRVIPIQYVSTSATASPVAVNKQQQPSNMNANTSTAKRVPANSSPSSPAIQTGGMVTAAKNCVSSVVAAVTNATSNGSLAPNGPNLIRRPGGSPTGGPADAGGYRSTFGVSAPPPSMQYASAQQRTQAASAIGTGVTARKPAASGSRSSGGSGGQQVSSDQSTEKLDAIEPEIAQLEAVIKSMVPGAPAATSPSNVDSKRYLTLQNKNGITKGDTLSATIAPSNGAFGVMSGSSGSNRQVIVSVRSRPPSPGGYQRMYSTSTTLTNNGPGGGGGGLQPIGGKRTPTPAPMNRIPLPTNGNGEDPVPAVTKTSALGTSMMEDARSLSKVSDQRRSSGSSSSSSQSQGTIGRKVKAVSGLANKLQRRVVAGVVGSQMGARLRLTGSNETERIRSTQV